MIIFSQEKAMKPRIKLVYQRKSDQAEWLKNGREMLKAFMDIAEQLPTPAEALMESTLIPKPFVWRDHLGFNCLSAHGIKHFIEPIEDEL